MIVRSIIIVGLLGLTACQSAKLDAAPITQGQTRAETDEGQIKALLIAQDIAWNEGDIDAFMDGYWKNEQLRFASGGTVTRGWEETNKRYHERYSSREKMGRLLTTEHEVELLSPDAAVAHGRWRLERANDSPNGLYTLLLRKFDGHWKIVSDTTTSAD